MFPTAGYFKGVECPFYKEGTCHRPYCHYKHAKLRVQPIVRQPTRFPHTSTLSGKITKSEVKHQYAPQQSTSDNSNDQQKVASLPARAVDSQPTDVKVNVMEDQEEKQSKHDTPVSYSQMTGGSNPDVSQSGGLYTQPRTTTSSDVKEQCASESECLNKKDKISVEESHHRHTTNTTAEVQGSPIMVSQSHSDNIHAFTVTCEPQEKMHSTVTPAAAEYKAEHTDINTSVLPVSHTIQSSGSDEVPPLQDEVLYKEANENMMFEELFGSSGEEDHKEEDDVIEGAVYDYSDDDMELGDHREIDQRKVEEEFKRIITPSTGLPHTAVPKRSYENLGIKNKRQAHSNAELLRHGGVTVGRPKAKTTSSMNPLLNDPSAIYAGKKRKAHGQGGSSSDVTTAPAPKRPRLLVSVNAKIPTALRQNYLDCFIDEYLKFCHAEEAYKKGLDDEQALFKKANNKMLYMNLSSIALKRLRERASKEQPCSPISSSSDTKKTSPPVSKRHSTNMVSSTTNNRAPVQEKKVKKAEFAEPPPGTYYLDEIFKTTVNMEMHQKDKPHSGTNHDSAGVGNLETSSDSIVSNKDHQGKEKSTSKAKRPLSFDSALQKIDRKLMSKRERPRASSPSVKKQIGSSKIFPSSQQSTKGTEHEEVQSFANSPTNAKPTSVHVQKLIDKGFAKVKTKSGVEQSHPTNRISLTSNRLVKSSANVSKGLSLAGQHNEQTDKLKKKSVRQIFVNKSSPLTSPTSESVSSTSAATGPTISAAQFYSSKVSKQGKIKVNIKSNPTSISVPASKTEKHSSSPNYSILKKKEVLLTDEIFIRYMNSYLLTEAQLVENGYPRPTGEPGVASIVRKPDDVNDIKPVGPNAQRHTCCRCGKPFIIYNSGSYQSTEECCYHFKRLQKKKEYGEGVISYYPCCQGNRGSSGCQIAKMHVTKGAKLPLESGYVQTGRHPNMNNYTPTVYALDCEMCYTTAGLELTRVSVVGTNNESVYESLVKPDYPVVDYNTKFSGITAQDLASVTTTLRDVQNNLLNLFYEDTILLGHSLESDLQSLKIIHSCVVDTALVFPHRMGLPYKRALRNITAEFLHKIIQDEVDGGHDSKEDAIACMDLMKWKIKSDLQKTTRRGSVT